MYKKLVCSITLAVLLIAVSAVQAEVVVSTAEGNGADTSLENDGQSGNHGPDSLHGTDGTLTIRRYDGVRQKIGYVRFDLTGIAGDLSGAALTVDVSGTANRTRNWAVYGLIDETLDNWDEGTINYNNAPGFLPANTAYYTVDETKLQRLGTMEVGNVAGVYTSTTANLDLTGFLRSDTNKLVTFVAIPDTTDTTASWTMVAKESDPARAPKLTLPGAALSAAMDPNPTDKADDVIRDGVILSWTAGVSAISHDVYFGTNPDSVKNASRTNSPGVLAGRGQGSSTFALGRLDFNQTYYWRVDEVVGSSGPIYGGTIWSFTVEPLAIPIDSIVATASSQVPDQGPENTVNGSGLVDQRHSTKLSDMWLTSESNAGPVWIQFDFEKAYELHEMLVWDYNREGLNTIYGLRDVIIEHSTDGASWTLLSDVPEFPKAPGTNDYTPSIVNLRNVIARYVKITANSNWSGGLFNQYGLSEVRFMAIPVSARKPSPDVGATDVAVDVTLGWRAGRQVARHNVYLGADPNALTLTGSATQPAFDTASLGLALGQNYYWRVDEVNNVEVTATWQGDLWSFSTREFLVVDDFEDYNEFEPSTVYNTWTDGFQDPANGSTVGYLLGNPHETQTVHGGSQSVPLMYNNTTATFSEVTVNTNDLAIGRDWTIGAPKALVLWFYGHPGNATTQRMYVKINGSKILYGGDAIDLARPQWTQWSIDLAAFGVNLGNVTTLSIGFERTGAAGGSGTIFIDDIRLYGQAPPLPTEVVWVEAETGTVTAPTRLFDDPNASGGRYVSTETGTADAATAPPYPSGTVSIPFTVKGGTYTLRFRIGFPGGDDSCWVRIPDATTQSPVHSSGWVHFNDIPTGDFWHWSQQVKSEDQPGEPPVEFTLAAGTHTLEISYRGADLRIDAIVISKVD